jgi:hypothetical protein
LGRAVGVAATSLPLPFFFSLVFCFGHALLNCMCPFSPPSLHACGSVPPIPALAEQEAYEDHHHHHLGHHYVDEEEEDGVQKENEPGGRKHSVRRVFRFSIGLVTLVAFVGLLGLPSLCFSTADSLLHTPRAHAHPPLFGACSTHDACAPCVCASVWPHGTPASADDGSFS